MALGDPLTGYDFEEYTGATRLTKCRQYLSALRQLIATPDASADGRSMSHGTLAALIESTQRRLDQLEGASGTTFGGVTRVRV